jgi:hypothetical protein
MEMEAYLKGNMLMRDFEDNFKYQQEWYIYNRTQKKIKNG